MPRYLPRILRIATFSGGIWHGNIDLPLLRVCLNCILQFTPTLRPVPTQNLTYRGDRRARHVRPTTLASTAGLPPTTVLRLPSTPSPDPTTHDTPPLPALTRRRALPRHYYRRENQLFYTDARLFD